MTGREDCQHKWRYSNGRDIFFCQFCYLTEWPDVPEQLNEPTNQKDTTS
tara:strand:+ start:305 stop:451 length:147 start_codon:yes stop_codon:yes gene_type:complete